MEYASIEDVNLLAGRIKDNWSLCQLFEGRRRACEAEMMVAQTIHAAKLNAKEHGKPFSFRGAGVFCWSGAGLVDNASAYAMLCEEEFFIEDKHDGRTVIFPTKKLVKYLNDFFSSKETQ